MRSYLVLDAYNPRDDCAASLDPPEASTARSESLRCADVAAPGNVSWGNTP